MGFYSVFYPMCSKNFYFFNIILIFLRKNCQKLGFLVVFFQKNVIIYFTTSKKK